MREGNSTMTTSTYNFLAASNAYNFAVNMADSYAARNNVFMRDVWMAYAERALALMKLATAN